MKLKDPLGDFFGAADPKPEKYAYCDDDKLIHSVFDIKYKKKWNMNGQSCVPRFEARDSATKWVGRCLPGDSQHANFSIPRTCKKSARFEKLFRKRFSKTKKGL